MTARPIQLSPTPNTNDSGPTILLPTGRGVLPSWSTPKRAVLLLGPFSKLTEGAVELQATKLRDKTAARRCFMRATP